LREQFVIRAFIAVEVDSEVLQRIFAVTDDLNRAIPDIRWTPQANCHLTLKFLGNIEEKQIDPIGQALEDEVSLFPRCTINAKGLGVFPDAKRPRVLWVGIEGKPLAALAKSVEIALGALGFEKEQRGFSPHLTIGRWRQGNRRRSELEHALEHWQAYDFGRSSVDEVKLLQSVLKPGGAEYRPLKSVRLNDQSALA
jgi:RNA 2',3'-cyclic 3'-phosphodiesterase